MKKFKVFACYTTYCTVEVEAEDSDHAEALAKEIDGGQFIPSKECFDWHINHAQEIKETV
jgi:hypothetical protein